MKVKYRWKEKKDKNIIWWLSKKVKNVLAAFAQWHRNCLLRRRSSDQIPPGCEVFRIY
jgi:hypothetical protein